MSITYSVNRGYCFRYAMVLMIQAFWLRLFKIVFPATSLNKELTYDKMDNITTKQTEHGNYDYGYDDLYRLTSSDNPVGGTDETFTYDSVGNRLTAADTTGEWAYNLNNELGGYDDVTYEYDANGNTVKKTAGGVVTSYVYNTEDLLTQVWDGEVGTGSLTASYYYDPFGRRLWKDVGGIRTYFHYADEGLIGEYDGAGAEIKTYGYKPSETWNIDPLFMKVGEEYYFYQNDHLGTPQKMTTISGAVVWSARYSSFGKAQIDSASIVVNNLRFPGQYFDSESGFYYNLWRYYDPQTGKYITVDPIGFWGGINLYGYVGNNPTIFVDPEGLVLDTILDIGFILYDLHVIAKCGLNWTNGIALGLDMAGAVLPFATGLGKAWTATRRLGEVGEAFAKIPKGAKGKLSIPSLTKTTRNGKRFPDQVTASVIKEVKNKSVLSPSDYKQIRDSLVYAHQKGEQVELYLRRTTEVGDVEKLINHPDVTVKYLSVDAKGQPYRVKGVGAAMNATGACECP